MEPQKKVSSGAKAKKIVCLTLATIAVMVAFSIVYWETKTILGLDFSLNYHKIEGVENIVFQSNWGKHLYQRCFWGLRKAGDTIEFREQNEPERIRMISELKGYIQTENGIRQAVASPDGKYILYCEIEYNYYRSDVTDDEYCYYRVYEIETGDIVTIYGGYRQWYNLDWQ